MLRNEIFAFADEYGNNSFDFDSQGSHFIVASIIVPGDKLNETERIVEAARKKHFQTGEIKSIKVGDKHERRVRVLNDLLQAEFSIYAVVVDKRRLMGEGFKYKKSFYKFLNGLVYKELFNTFPKLTLTVDEHGDNEFMRQFKKYVQKNHISDLFSGSEFGFSKSPDSILVQLADFIAGTLGRCFDERKQSADSARFLELLKPRITSINYFPDLTRNIKVDADLGSDTHNPAVAEMGIQSAKLFIEQKKEAKDQDDVDQLNCAKLLLLYFNTYGLRNYLPAKELIRHLNAGRPEPIEMHHFRTKVIAKLRDAGVLVVSSATGQKKGYKLPSSLAELHKFVSHGNSMIIPMLSRIKLFREKIRLASHNEIDILEHPEFEGLKNLLS